MRLNTTLLALLAAAVMPVAWASDSQVIAPMDHPHAVIASSIGEMAGHVYGVNILKIGPQKSFAERNNIPVKPGKYVLRVSPDLQAMSRNESTRLLKGKRHPNPQELVKEITVNLDAGKRYFIGAHYDGPTLQDWHPVVAREEPLAME